MAKSPVSDELGMAAAPLRPAPKALAVRAGVNVPGRTQGLNLTKVIGPVGAGPGRPFRQTAALLADRAGGAAGWLRAESRQRRTTEPAIARCGAAAHGSGLGVRRWAVERTRAGLDGQAAPVARSLRLKCSAPFKTIFITLFSLVVSALGLRAGQTYSGANGSTVNFATYVATDTVTLGSWQGKYGQDGSVVVGDVSVQPAYGRVDASGINTWTWGATNDLRGLQTYNNGRIASCFYSPEGTGSRITIDVSTTDSQTHRLAIYALDWDGDWQGRRQETIEILDGDDDTVLDSKALPSFTVGEYLVWDVRGHVKVRAADQVGKNAIINGIFIGPPEGGPANIPPTVSLLSPADGATAAEPASFTLQADARDRDGTVSKVQFFANGSLLGESAAPPYVANWSNVAAGSYALKAIAYDNAGASGVSGINTVTISGRSVPTVTVVSPLDGATTNAPGSFTLSADARDPSGYITTVQYFANDALITEATQSPFASQWNNVATGSYRLTAKALSSTGASAVSSPVRVIVNGAPPPGGTASATFVGIDQTSQGSWEGRYGTEGYNIFGDLAKDPPYATINASNISLWQWSFNNEPQALHRVVENNRVAAVLYDPTSFSIDVNMTDSQIHRLAVYAMDWDNRGRQERVEIVDAVSGAVLNSRSLSSFVRGEYVSWDVSGHIKVRAVNLNGSTNAALNGIFLGSPRPPQGLVTYLTNDGDTKGNWAARYGKDGYLLKDGSASLPSYVASITVRNNHDVVWENPTADVRGLWDPQTRTRVAAAWTSPTNDAGSSFTIDVNLTDNRVHQIALYALDWEPNSFRKEIILGVDGETGQLLDLHDTHHGNQGGQYMLWQVRGKVQFQVINNDPAYDAVISGLFFDTFP